MGQVDRYTVAIVKEVLSRRSERNGEDRVR